MTGRRRGSRASASRKAASPGFLKPLQLTRPGPSSCRDAHEVRLGMSRPGADRDALRGDRPEAERHRLPEDADVVVHGGEDHGVRQPDAGQVDGEAGIVPGEPGRRLDGEDPQEGLAQADRRWLGESEQQAVVEQVVEAIGERQEHRPGAAYNTGSPAAMTETPRADERRFVADVMLGRLARWLRALGYDTLYYRDAPDSRLLGIALREARTLLTRDAGLAARAGPAGRLVRAEGVDAQLREVVDAFALRPPAPLSRCLECNGPLAVRTPPTCGTGSRPTRSPPSRSSASASAAAASSGPVPTPAASCAASSPSSPTPGVDCPLPRRTIVTHGRLAQLAEHRPHMPGVAGSSPASSTTRNVRQTGGSW